jgi:hypothetical protein
MQEYQQVYNELRKSITEIAEQHKSYSLAMSLSTKRRHNREPGTTVTKGRLYQEAIDAQMDPTRRVLPDRRFSRFKDEGGRVWTRVNVHERTTDAAEALRRRMSPKIRVSSSSESCGVTSLSKSVGRRRIFQRSAMMSYALDFL